MGLLVLNYCLDLIAFAILVIAGALIARRYACRAAGGCTRHNGHFMIVAVIAIGGILAAWFMGLREAGRQQQIVSSMAPTYASELRQMGHEFITVDTDPEDPQYLAMIHAQRRWLELNPHVADVYTFGKDGEGRVILLVDSETDYDRNGRYEGERESRTDIGEPYEEDSDNIARAFAGETVFTDRPVTDRWGTWVSTYAPIRNGKGVITAVLGVDYFADEWIASILAVRITALTFTFLVSAVLVISQALTGAMRAEVARRRRTESALRASERRLRMILDNEPECVVVTDREGRLIEMNPAGLQMAGVNGTDILGRHFTSMISEAHRERVRAHYEQTLQGRGGIVEFDITGFKGDRRVCVETHTAPLTSDNGQIISVLSVARDVTARKQAEAQREQLQRQLVDASRQAGMAEIATGVLHNVGNAVTNVNVIAEQLAEDVARSKSPNLSKAAAMLTEHMAELPRFLSEDRRGKQLPTFLVQLAEHLGQEMQRTQQQLGSLRDGLTHVREIVATQQAFAKSASIAESIPVHQLVSQTVKLVQSSLDKHQVTLNCDCPEGLTVRCDRSKLQQALVNLLNNANESIRDAGPAERAIRVCAAASTDGSNVTIEVRDTGLGIESEHMARLFQNGFTTKAQGHGFGLHYSALAVREMGGKLTAASDGRGRGATFRIELPAGTTAAKEMAS